MTIEALSTVASTLSLAPPATSAANVVAPNSTSSAGAFDALVKTLEGVNSQVVASQNSVNALALGQSDDLHRVMMNLESTKLAFDLALQVRNKLLDAYQELMRMQV